MDDEAQRVVVIDLNVPFLTMVDLMIKWAFASIPAAIIIAFWLWIGMSLMERFFGLTLL
jgi:hypothetical protein